MPAAAGGARPSSAAWPPEPSSEVRSQGLITAGITGDTATTGATRPRTTTAAMRRPTTTAAATRPPTTAAIDRPTTAITDGHTIAGAAGSSSLSRVLTTTLPPADRGPDAGALSWDRRLFLPQMLLSAAADRPKFRQITPLMYE